MFRQIGRIFVTLLLVSFCCNAALACDRWLEAKNPQGIVLLTQGMNLKSEKLLPLAQFFVDQNFSVFLPSFQGHCAGRGSYLTATAEDWLKDAESFYREAKRQAEAKNLPLYLAAYSFSALLFELQPELRFEKKVLFAPAFATHYWYPVVRILAKWFPDWRFKTRNIPDHAANLETSFHAVKVVGDLLEMLEVSTGNLPPETPTLVIGDLEDELVNVHRVRKIAESRRNWRFQPVTNVGNPMPESFHHLIVTPASLSEREWQRMLVMIQQFLR
jgi:esterase/lipase